MAKRKSAEDRLGEAIRELGIEKAEVFFRAVRTVCLCGDYSKSCPVHNTVKKERKIREVKSAS